MGVAQCLLGSFSPSDWSEERYASSPPYVLENISGRVSIVPGREQTEIILDDLSKSLGLKKRKQGHTYYVVSRSDSIRGLRQFDWFVRRSWRSKEFVILWALFYIAQIRGWNREQRMGISLGSLAELSNCDESECTKVLGDLLGGKLTQVHRNGFGEEYEVSEEQAHLVLKKFLSELPTWNEEMLMNALCSGTGGSMADIYENIMMLGLTIGAAYKIVERLKDKGYIYPLRHFRVNERGPMRELLTANCRNCFYGYTSEERCLSGTLKQLQDVLERYYGRKLSSEERSGLYSLMRSIPFGSRISRRVLESLRLVHQVEKMTTEGRVIGMLKKIEERYGINLPIKTPPISSVSSRDEEEEQSLNERKD